MGQDGDENRYSNWLAGYLTAYDAWVPATYDIRGREKMLGTMVWLEDYCKVHPRDKFTEAMERLIAELHPTPITLSPRQ